MLYYYWLLIIYRSRYNISNVFRYNLSVQVFAKAKQKQNKRKNKMENKITIPTGEVIAIGKFKVFKTEQFPYTIQTLSFVVAKKNDVYTASCLHLVLDASAKNDIDAVVALQKVCQDFLLTIFNNNEDFAWEQINDLVQSESVIEYWNAYRSSQVILSKKGISTDGSYVDSLSKKIERLKKELKEYKASDNKIDIDVVEYDKVA